jgi:hypothetical protein
MATPNLAHHNQLQLLNQQQRQQNPAYAKERVQAIIQVCSLTPCAYTFHSHFKSSVHTTSALRVLPPRIIKNFRISYGLFPTFRPSKLSRMVRLSTASYTLHWLHFTPNSSNHSPRTPKSRTFPRCEWTPSPPTTDTAHSEWNDRLPPKFPRFWFISSTSWAFHHTSLIHTGADKHPPRTNPSIQDPTTGSPGSCRATEYYPPLSV